MTPTVRNLVVLENGRAPWYDAAWLYRKQIIVASATLPATLLNFPLLISLTTDAELAAKALSTGNDILFTSRNGRTKLDHEIVTYTTATGLLIAWVRLPTASPGAKIYMYYGNAAASAQANPTGVWDSTYGAVYHLGDAASPALDSTTNANSMTQSGGVTFGTAAQVGNGVTLDGSNDKLSATSSASLNVTGALTLEAWIKPTQATTAMRFCSKVVTTGATNNPYDFGKVATDQLYLNRATAAKENFYGSISTVAVNVFTRAVVRCGGAATAFTGTSLVKDFGASAKRTWQGVATDGTYIYVVTNLDGSGQNNIISKVLIADGTVAYTKLTAYNPLGTFYDFGNAFYDTDTNELLVTAYNGNSIAATGDPNYTPTSNLLSRVAVFDPADGSLLRDYALGNAVLIAEGLAKKDGFYWVVDGWFNTYIVKKYDTSFNLIATYTLPVQSPFTNELTYQGVAWRGNDLFVNWHGDNGYSVGGSYAKGMDRYTWNGTAFTFAERLRPVTFGAGQGFAIFGDTFYWADRPGNQVYSSTYVGSVAGSVDPFSVEFFINGVRDGNAAVAGSPFTLFSDATTNAAVAVLGTRGDSTNFFKGIMDEVRISNVARSDAWIAASYANESSPSTFYALGAEQAL